MRLLSLRTAVFGAVLLLAGGAAAYFTIAAGPLSGAAGLERKAVMYKPLQCGCCDEYAAYLEKHGFEVEVNSMRSLGEIRREAGVPRGFEGCHTLLVGGYTVDGLVPIGPLQRLLSEKPDVRGITLPGMPWGAPGMEQRPKEGPLVVYAFGDDSRPPTVYARE
jgi:hypothetical protein